ncbi:hypothetical protein PP175_26105 (plasmid) [Aneurinibacillus sp. Ricciae_BoGa-3]|uniref:hypothetical protein n=1 Tax=Aneurinibacillus sp. Ricciae_BoGa-3 TaxID=3022697 RepID=UPI0023423C4A|nr:hypothetical protein [Aneurinibacillus sp. Ricciae_BoGa-3]WCK57541.1 hypothetical protein PP175_26105 [Aneurinibacillus sp. Ricciae_BoGa-3]
MRINFIEPYDSKKYRDDFGNKANPLKSVASITFVRKGRETELILKFTKTHPTEQDILDKAKRWLSENGLIDA